MLEFDEAGELRRVDRIRDLLDLRDGVQEFDDAAGCCGWVLERGVVGEAEVDALFQRRVDVGIGGGRGVAGEVGGGADKGAAELAEQLMAEVELGQTYPNGAVGGREVVGDGGGEHSDG